jgi:imidazoleglycerol phosphate dehydratase HisB
MNETPKPPDPEVIQKTVRNLRGVCQRLDALTLSLDELIAMVEVDIRNSPINVYRRENAKRLAESFKQE